LAIGFDLDGVLTILKLRNNNTKLPWWFGLWLALVPPNKKIIDELRKRYAAGEIVIIVSARHKQLASMTKWQLKIHGIPFSDLILVGVGKDVPERKLAVIRERGLSAFIDDDVRTVNFLKDGGINAVLYK